MREREGHHIHNIMIFTDYVNIDGTTQFVVRHGPATRCALPQDVKHPVQY
jgi:hypothetical protein